MRSFDFMHHGVCNSNNIDTKHATAAAAAAQLPTCPFVKMWYTSGTKPPL
jgi:hypothetical protein